MMGIEPVSPITGIHYGTDIYDWIVSSIRKSDIFLCDLTDKNLNVTYELGLAHAWGIPTLILTQNIATVPYGLSKYQMLLYDDSPNGIDLLRVNLRKAFESFLKPKSMLSETTIERYIDKKETISLEITDNQVDAFFAFSAISTFLGTVEKLANLESIELVELRQGSLAAWVSTNIDSVILLIDSLIFIVPEYKRRTAENTRINAEIKLVDAKAKLIEAVTKEIESETERRDYLSLVNSLENFSQFEGFKINIGDEVSIEKNEREEIVFKKRR